MDKELKQMLFENDFYLNWSEQTDLKVVKYFKTSGREIMHAPFCYFHYSRFADFSKGSQIISSIAIFRAHSMK